jgi:hypothetical protein
VPIVTYGDDRRLLSDRWKGFHWRAGIATVLGSAVVRIRMNLSESYSLALGFQSVMLASCHGFWYRSN